MVAFKYYQSLDTERKSFLKIPLGMSELYVGATHRNKIFYRVCGTGFWCGEPDYSVGGTIEGDIQFPTEENAIKAFEAMVLWDKSQGILDLTPYQLETPLDESPQDGKLQG